jgi:YD repeat-containing protein
MKTNTLLVRPAIIIFIIINLLSGSCKKDNNNNEDINYRITNRSFYNNDTLSSVAAYLYTDIKITSVKYFYYSNRGDSIKTKIEYPDESTVAQETYIYYIGVWYPFKKYIIEYQDGKIQSTVTYYLDGSYWSPDYKEEYQYSGEKLSEEVWYYYEYSAWVPDFKISYLYSGDLVTVANYFDYNNDWQIVGKDEAIFTGDKIDQVVGYACAEDTIFEQYKYKFNYLGSLLTRIDAFYYFNSYWDTIGEYSFTYDAHGNLTSEASSDEVSSQKIEYAYEIGQGNYLQLISPGGGLISYSSYPSPTKFSRESCLPSFDPGRYSRGKKFIIADLDQKRLPGWSGGKMHCQPGYKLNPGN